MLHTTGKVAIPAGLERLSRSCTMNPADGEHSTADGKSDTAMRNDGSSKYDETTFATSPSPQRTALPLKRFLAQAPKRSLYQYNSVAQQTIIVKCFQSMWHDNIDYMQKYFFPNATGDRRNLKSIIAKHRQQSNPAGSTTLSSNTENVILDEDSDGPEYWESQRGRQCGHVFKKGEAIYQCRYVCFSTLQFNICYLIQFILDEIEIAPSTIHAYFALDAIMQLTMKAMTSRCLLALVRAAVAIVEIPKLGRFQSSVLFILLKPQSRQEMIRMGIKKPILAAVQHLRRLQYPNCHFRQYHPNCSIQ
jgi:hypothetical protein